MTNQHPITPSPELVDQWSAFIYQVTGEDNERDFYIATQAAQWGADQELSKCVEFLGDQETWDQLNMCTYWKQFRDESEELLREARRPKPLRLKEQALKAIDDIEWRTESLAYMGERIKIIRQSLEALDD